MSEELRALLAWRIRTAAPPGWGEFSTLWMAFNAIYRGDPDPRERYRVMSTIRRLVNHREARRLLRDRRLAIERIVAIPPGNLQLDRYDPKLRRASQRCAAIYRDPQEAAPTRLAGVGGVLYQVRCNLVHGGKDPDVRRDRMLVAESLHILRDLVPAVEAGAHARVARRREHRIVGAQAA